VHIEITLDCLHLDRMARFWGLAAGLEVVGGVDGPRTEFGQTWFVLADPEGNGFCVANED